jgi:phosphoglucomutase
MMKMKEIMASLRTNAPQTIGGLKVIGTADYLKSESTDLETGAVTKIDLPKSDVVSFMLPDHASVIVRPSGTEPKIKAYYTTVCKTMEEAAALEEKLRADVHKLLV